MPIGFIDAQVQPQRKLPTGNVTFLLTDIEGSTGDDVFAASRIGLHRGRSAFTDPGYVGLSVHAAVRGSVLWSSPFTCR